MEFRLKYLGDVTHESIHTSLQFETNTATKSKSVVKTFYSQIPIGVGGVSTFELNKTNAKNAKRLVDEGAFMWIGDDERDIALGLLGEKEEKKKPAARRGRRAVAAETDNDEGATPS